MPPKRKCDCCPAAEVASTTKFNVMRLTVNMQRKYQRDNSWPSKTGDRLTDMEAGMQYLKDLIEENQQDFYFEVSKIVSDEAASTDQLDEVREDLKEQIDGARNLESALEDAITRIEDLEEKVESLENKLKS